MYDKPKLYRAYQDIIERIELCNFIFDIHVKKCKRCLHCYTAVCFFFFFGPKLTYKSVSHKKQKLWVKCHKSLITQNVAMKEKSLGKEITQFELKFSRAIARIN